MKILKDKIIFDSEDWLAGLDPQHSANLANQVGTRLPTVRSMNPYRMLGMCSPGFAPADVENVAAVDTFIKKAVVNGTTAYATTAATKLHKITGLSTTPSITNAGAWPYAVTAHGGHSGPVLSDVVLYNHKVGGTSALRLLYSWYDNTDWDIGTFDLNATFDDDFMSTAPATPLASPYLAGGVTQPHPMIVGDDDILYIGDRNFLHAYDGNNAADNDGKFFPNALDLPNDWIITSMVKFNQYLVLFAYKTVAGSNLYFGESRAFFWNYMNRSSSWEFSKNLNDNSVSESFEYAGTIGCFTQGRAADQYSATSKVSKLLLFNGSEFEQVTTFDSNVPTRGGVDVKGRDIFWNSQGKVYIWDGARKTLNQVAEGTGTTSGLLQTLNMKQFISTGATTSGGLQTLSDNYYHATLVYTGLATPSWPEDTQGEITRVKVKFAKTSSGGRNIMLTLRNRIADVSTIISSADALKAITSSNLVTEYYPTGAYFDALRAVVQWESGSAATDAPIIDTIEIYFKTISLKA